jgi:Asp-tRNA(Asn)/Glu-tRNA(Gln) amidotransferase A subunit family amidase
VEAFTRAYRSGARSPVEAASACFAAVRASEIDDPPLRAVIRALEPSALAAATSSAERRGRGQPLSPLDGVPVMIKDNLDVAGVETTNGTRMPFPIPERTAWVVERLRAAGAVIVGKTNLHEIGAGVTGVNPHHGAPRNPYDPSRWCGGSSSGAAAAVGAGLVPLAIGTDAGGSIRAPAVLCGVVGLKPTFGRVSRVGMSILCDTLDHIGPLAASCADAALCLRAIAGPNRADEESWDQPPLPGWAEIERRVRGDVRGARIGFARRLLDHPWVDPTIATHVARAATALGERGASLVDVELPSVDRCRNIGLILLGAEGPSGLEQFLAEHEALLGLDLQVMLRIGAHISARDYLQAQRVRNEIRHEWAEILRDVEAVLLPAAGQVAGLVHADALTTGELDEATSARVITCMFPSNLTGFPAVGVPCGWMDGLPVGAQIVARPWEDLRALDIAAAIEAAGLFAPRRPVRWYG